MIQFLPRILLVYFTAFYGITLQAQKPYLYFNRISTQNGLSHNKVNCIMQDKRGFIWIGTDDGLNRYDGNYFTVFRHQPNNAASISGNIITGLLEDKNGIIWIATTDGGLTRYDYRLEANKQFKQYKHVQGDSSTIPVNIINTLTEDKYGYLWLASSSFSVLRFNKKTEQFEMPVTRKGTKTILAISIDDNGILWAGRQGGGVLKVNTKDLSYESDERYSNLYDTNVPHATVTSLYHDSEDYMWMGSWDNILYRTKISTGKEDAFKNESNTYSFPNDDVHAFAEDNKGRLWMGGRYFGLTIYDRNQEKFYNYRYDASLEGTVADDQVNCIYKDHDGFMWLGTNKGISVYNPSQQPFVQTFLSPEHKDITIYDFYKERSGKLWLATSEGIFTRLNDSSSFVQKKIIYKGEPLSVSKFFIDDDGTWYIGTNYSFFKYDQIANTISVLPNTDNDRVIKKIIDSRIVSIIKDTINKHPVLMVAPYGHYFAYYDLIDKFWVSRMDTARDIINNFNLKDNLIRKFYKTRDGNIWLATGKFGLGKWEKNPRPKVDHLCNNPMVASSISNDDVYDILEDNKGNLWVSTFGGGLNYFNTVSNTFEHIEATNNLSEGIQIDVRQNIWIISNGNLHKYDPVTKTSTSFILPDLEKSGGVRGNIYKDDNDNFYVAGTNYFIKFNPASVKVESKQPSVYFTDFKIFNNSFSDLLTQQNIQLRYFQNYFTIEFSAPEFTGNNVEYSYRLIGLDNNWIDIGTRNFANYSNLPGGNFTFEVRATNKKGSWNAKVSSLSISIIPPFWKQWWFFALCSVVIAAGIYAFYRYRINELLKRQAIRNKIAQDLHDNMGSTLSSISVYSQVAKIYNQQQKKDDLQQTLEKIGSTSGEMISEMGDIVWAINPKNDNLNTIIQRMESFAKPLLQAKNIAFSFNYNIASPELNMQMDKRKNFYLIYKEAINNVIKYANCKKLDVSITQHANMVKLIMKDDGVGFDPDKINIAASKSLSGNGLKNMQMRAKEMKASYHIESQPGKGTAIHLSFHIP